MWLGDSVAITPQQLYDTMKGYMGDVSYDFFNDYLQVLVNSFVHRR